jgi:arginine-tRNA-protein transferase
VGVGIIDITFASLNAVYFYFDPDLVSRSLGTFNILQLIELCRREEKEFLYLGYRIAKVPAMSYKARFKPHYLLVGQRWRRVERPSSPLESP